MDRSITIAAMGCGLLVAFGIGAATFTMAKRERAMAREKRAMVEAHEAEAARAELMRATIESKNGATATDTLQPERGPEDPPSARMRALPVRITAPFSWPPARGERIDLIATWGTPPSAAIVAQGVRVLAEATSTTLTLELHPIEVMVVAQIRASEGRFRAIQRPESAGRIELSHVGADELPALVARTRGEMQKRRSSSTLAADVATLRSYAIDPSPEGLRPGDRVDVLASPSGKQTAVIVDGAFVAAVNGTRSVVLLSLPECLVCDHLARSGPLTFSRRNAEDTPDTGDKGTTASNENLKQFLDVARKLREAREREEK